MMTAESVSSLAAEASAIREKLGDTLGELRTRASPDALFQDAFDTVSVQGQRMLGKTRETLASHPIAIGAAVAAIGLALFTRSQFANATVNLGDDAGDYTDYDDSHDERFAAPPAAGPASALAGLQNSISGNPMLSVAIGLAIGAVAGAFNPSSKE